MRIICHGLTGEDFPVEFVDHEISLGSKETNGIAITAATGVSDCHAFLMEEGEELFIRDNGSQTGTFLNHNRIQDKRKVSSGDIIQIGDREIRVDIVRPADDAMDIDRTMQTVVNINDAAKGPEQTVTLNFLPIGKYDDNSIDATAMTMMSDELAEQIAADKEAADKEAAAKEAAANDDYDRTMVSDGAGTHPSSISSTGSQTTLPAGVSSTQAIFISGREIGKYIIVKRIGKGGMGEVYLAKHKTLGTYRALKVLPREFLEDNDKFLDRFIREAKLASEIRHPNVVGVMDVETDTEFGCPYIVMEYIDGGSLRNILKSTKTLSEEQAVVIVEAIASALRAAESFSIVHRDIKPDNIMFTKQGEVKLADLGIAKNDDADNELTRTNVMIGTPAYLSPEQAQNAKGVDARADIYSLGATFYEMLTGEHPYPGHNTFEILHKLFADPVPDPRKINPEVSPASAAIVMKMMAKDAKDRFQSATELLETMDKTFPPHTAYESAELIKKVIAGDTEHNTAFSSGITTTQFAWQYKKYIKWAVLAAVVLLVLLGGGIGTIVALKGRKADVPPQPQQTAETSVTETDPFIEEPPPPVQVSRYDLQIKTTPDSEIHFISEDGQMRVYASNHEGMLKIPGLEPGTYKVRISRNNYRQLTQDVELKDNTELDLPLTADFKKLSITAQPGSKIRIEGVENGEKTMTVPADGSAVFPELLGETLFVHIELPGWETFEQTLLLNRDMEFQAQQKRVKVALTVRTAPNAEIVLKQEGKEVQTVKANSLGMAVADGIVAGEYQMEISSEGYHSKEMACDLTRNQNLNVDLQKITYKLQLNAAEGTQIMLFLNHQLQGTYLVPAAGNLNLTGMTPGKYSITAEKKGMVGQNFDIDLDKDMSFDCHLVEEVAVVTPPADEPDKPGDGQVAQQDEQETKPEEVIPPEPEKQEGIVSISFDASPELVEYLQGKGVEIKVGDETWSDIRVFPWSQKLEAGDYAISVRADGIRDLSVPQFTVKADQNNECTLEPVAMPSYLQFVSNLDDAEITFNGSACKPGQEVECDTFREVTVVGVHGEERLTRTVRSTKPGGKVMVEFLFTEPVKEEEPEQKQEVAQDTQTKQQPMQAEYEAGMKQFADKKYKDALKTFTPAAEAGNVDAALKVAEINERGLGMWFSDTKEAMKWYAKAADLGSAEAALKVAKAIDNGDYKGTSKEMLDYYLKACALNQADVFYRISNLYKTGYKEIPQNDAKSMDYLRQAAELGLPDAMFDLGVRYEKGDGVVSNIQTALKWINKAADAGSDKAKRYSKQLRQ